MERKLPSRQDFADYAEGIPPRDALLQQQILQILATDSDLRQQLAELKKDLYLANALVPEFDPNPALSEDLRQVAETWLRLTISRRLDFRKFLRAKEFIAFLLFLVVIGWVAVYLILQSRL